VKMWLIALSIGLKDNNWASSSQINSNLNNSNSINIKLNKTKADKSYHHTEPSDNRKKQ